MVVLLDNAASAEQVQPLIATSTRSVVVVTSRLRLDGLVIDGAQLVEVPPLAQADTMTLLTELVGERRAGDELAALAELAQLCGRFPIALRVAAARRPDHHGRGPAALPRHRLVDARTRSLKDLQQTPVQGRRHPGSRPGPLTHAQQTCRSPPARRPNDPGRTACRRRLPRILTGRPARRGYDALTVADQLADDTSEYTKSDNRLMLHAALAQLPPRQRDIVTRRFVDELTQSQIAAKIGVPQMHVSRLLRSTLEQLRHHVV